MVVDEIAGVDGPPARALLVCFLVVHLYTLAQTMQIGWGVKREWRAARHGHGFLANRPPPLQNRSPVCMQM